MYSLDPAAVYSFPQLLDDPVCAARIGRVLGACGRSVGDLKLITPDTLGDVVGEMRALGKPKPRERALVFTSLDTGGEQPDWDALLARCPEGTPRDELVTVYGCAENVHYRERDWDQKVNHVCWCAHEFNTIWGCSHGCQYCGVGRCATRLVLGVNLEQYADAVVRRVLADNPWQKCYRLLGGTADQITFEPEYGAYEALGRVFAEFPDRYLVTHTASDNVEWLADFPYCDRLIHVYSLTSDDYAAALEPDTPTPTQRMEAAAYVERLGIPSRPKLKPVIPLRNWREDYERLIAELFARTRPQSIGMAVMMWMDLEHARQFLDLEQLDPVFAQAMVEQEEALRGVRTGPFTHEARAEIYRFIIRQIRRWDSDVPVYVSTESREMWDELEAELGQSKRAVVCGCGPMSTPDGKLRLGPEVRYTTYMRTPT